jgi:hypothetical protein
MLGRLIVRRSLFAGGVFKDFTKTKSLETLQLVENPYLTKEDIQDAFRRRAKLVHPDAGGSVKDFQDVTLAFEYLHDLFPTQEELLSVRTQMIEEREG